MVFSGTRGSRRPAGAARPQGRLARRHRRAFRLQCRQGACRLSRHHRPESAFDRRRNASRRRWPRPAATPSRHTRSRRRMRPGRSSPRCRPITAEGQARPAELHLGLGDAGRTLPHGRGLSEGAQSGGRFGRPGTVIKVANIGADVQTPVTRIIADKAKKQVRAYDAAGKLVAAYPATIGSSDTPSPTGTHEVARVAFNPEYTYNPNINFKQGDNDKILTIPPGPNGPVGSIWIALSKPTYGIHGTPDPSKIGKTESHGCVRLTNWDAPSWPSWSSRASRCSSPNSGWSARLGAAGCWPGRGRRHLWSGAMSCRRHRRSRRHGPRSVRPTAAASCCSRRSLPPAWASSTAPSCRWRCRRSAPISAPRWSTRSGSAMPTCCSCRRWCCSAARPATCSACATSSSRASPCSWRCRSPARCRPMRKC